MFTFYYFTFLAEDVITFIYNITFFPSFKIMPLCNAIDVFKFFFSAKHTVKLGEQLQNVMIRQNQ